MIKVFTAALWLLITLPTLVACTEAEVDLAPDFELQTVDGNSVRLRDLRGQVVMINFWATWCAPCRQEMPALSQMYSDLKDEGFVLLGINLDQQSGKAREYLQQTPVTFPVLLDSQSTVANLYQNTAVPSSYFIDKRGELVHMHKGYRPGEEDKYRSIIQKLLAQ